MLKKLKLNGSMMILQDLIELIPPPPKKKILFIIGDCNAKVGIQEIVKVIGKFSFAVQNETEQRLRVLPREQTGHSKHPLPTTREMILHVNITSWSIPKSD